MAESPIGQYLVKMIGNLCFSLFALSVLVFTVIAVTYQPSDPWFDSPKALVSRSFTQTLTNSTIPSDDSILNTDEDLNGPNPPTDSPSSPDIVTVYNGSSTSNCGNIALNCSDPAVINAIRRYHSKAFKSLVFLSYDTPVPGTFDDRCEAAWLFRNKREKSWRKYRDYRWFVLSLDDNCAYKVTLAGKYRSGVIAGGKNRKKVNFTSNSSAVFDFPDSEINDTIPVVRSEAEFRKGRYLYYSRGGDYCKGMNQYLWSFLCGLGEAHYLNRTFVMDLKLCLASSDPSKNDREVKDFRLYFDFEHLKESASIVEEEEFLRDWKKWGQLRKRISVRKVATYKVTPMQLKRDQSNIIWRQFPGQEPENYWYRVCEGRAANVVHRPWMAVWKSKRLMNIVSEIAGKLDWDYDSVHVIRGEKAKNKERWPNLDADTSPDALVDKLRKVIQPRRKLYIATNEPYYNYFDKLRSQFQVKLLDDFKDLWGDQSEWYNETRELSGGRQPEFDEHMRVAVDTEVFYRAKTRVETFNNLTGDCKNGIHTC